MKAEPISSFDMRCSLNDGQVGDDVEELLLGAPLAGLDVFDTLITRSVGAPKDIFLQVGENLRKQGVWRHRALWFQCLRIASERLVRRLSPNREVFLSDIVHKLCTIAGLPHALEECVIAAELQEEKRCVRPVPFAANLLCKRHSSGLPTVLISDMYLRAEQIRELLLECGIEVSLEDIYVSCEHLCNKGSGALFRKVWTERGMDARDFVFLGNHLQVDVESPRKLGARSVHFREGNLNRYEALLLQDEKVDRGLGSEMAAASRLARLNVPCEDRRREIIRDVAAGVIAPVMTAYVGWVLCDAASRGIERLYFLSREGQVLLSIAERLMPKLGIEMDCRYLYASRQAWRLPSVRELGETEMFWIFAGFGHVSLRDIAARIGFSPEMMVRFAETVGVSGDPDRALSVSEFMRLKTLRHNSSFLNELYETAARYRASTTAYLLQEGLLDGIEWGFVDVGWFGSLQRALDGILFEHGRQTAHGYYFGLDRFSKDSLNTRARAFLFDNRQGWGGYLQPPHVRTLIEIFLRADHGMTKGYSQKEGRWKPDLVQDETPILVKWGLSTVHRSIQAFVEALDISKTSLPNFRNTRELACRLLCAFWEHPTDEEVSVWGSIPFSAEQTGERWFSMSQPLSTDDVLHNVLRLKVPRKHPDEWVLGSIRQSDPAIRLLLERPFLTACRLRRFSRTLNYIRPDCVLNRMRASKGS